MSDLHILFYLIGGVLTFIECTVRVPVAEYRPVVIFLLLLIVLLIWPVFIARFVYLAFQKHFKR